MSLHPNGLLRWNVRCDGCGVVRQVPVAPDYLAEDFAWLRRGCAALGWGSTDGRDLCPDCKE